MVNLERFTTNYRHEYPANEEYFQAEIKGKYENWQKRVKKYTDDEKARFKKQKEEMKKTQNFNILFEFIQL